MQAGQNTLKHAKTSISVGTVRHNAKQSDNNLQLY